VLLLLLLLLLLLGLSLMGQVEEVVVVLLAVQWVSACAFLLLVEVGRGPNLLQELLQAVASRELQLLLLLLLCL
jgi:Na+/alanine symporter